MRAVVLGLMVVAFLGIITLIGGGFYSVDQGERAVITRWGEIVRVEPPGFHTKTVWVEDANTIEMRPRLVRYKTAAYSFDQQPTEIVFSVLWHPVDSDENAEAIYRRFKTLDQMETNAIAPPITQALKTAFSPFTASRAIGERAKLDKAVLDAITAAMPAGLTVVDSVQIENIDFSDAYEHSVELRMQREVEVAQAEQEALKVVQQAKGQVAQAKGEAEANLARAQAEAAGSLARANAEAEGLKRKGETAAQITRMQGEADAYALQQKIAQLGSVGNMIELARVQRWSGNVPTSMIPGGAVPFVSLGPVAAQ